jgi:hypothetical protein
MHKLSARPQIDSVYAGPQTLENAIFCSGSEADECYSATAKTAQKAQKLVEIGFECIYDFDGVKVFKKRK